MLTLLQVFGISPASAQRVNRAEGGPPANGFGSRGTPGEGRVLDVPLCCRGQGSYPLSCWRRLCALVLAVSAGCCRERQPHLFVTRILPPLSSRGALRIYVPLI